VKSHRHVADRFVHSTFATLLGLTTLFGCSSKPQSQPPTADQQKKIEQDYQKTMEQQKKLTSGYDKSMQYTPPSTGYVPNKQNAAKQQQGPKQQPSSQQQAQQQSSQQQPPPQSQPKK
jgi:hypothetical protein